MNTITNKWIKGSVKWFLPFYLFAFLLFSACSESDDSAADEYANWKERNDNYWENLYQTAQNNADGQWRILRTWSKDEANSLARMDYVIVHVEATGSGTESPLYTDTVQVHYAGRLIPTTSYPQGFQFDQSFTGSYDTDVMKPSKGCAAAYVDGFTTALLYMHQGDRWTVYIPYKLGYDANERSSIPAYSNLIFDLTLQSFSHPGTVVPEWKAKKN